MINALQLRGATIPEASTYVLARTTLACGGVSTRSSLTADSSQISADSSLFNPDSSLPVPDSSL